MNNLTVDYDRFIVSSALGNTIYCHTIDDARTHAINESIMFKNDVRIYDSHHPDYGTWQNYFNARLAVYRNGLEIEVRD